MDRKISDRHMSDAIRQDIKQANADTNPQLTVDGRSINFAKLVTSGEESRGEDLNDIIMLRHDEVPEQLRRTSNKDQPVVIDDEEDDIELISPRLWSKAGLKARSEPKLEQRTPSASIYQGDARQLDSKASGLCLDAKKISANVCSFTADPLTHGIQAAINVSKSTSADKLQDSFASREMSRPAYTAMHQAGHPNPILVKDEPPAEATMALPLMLSDDEDDEEEQDDDESEVEGTRAARKKMTGPKRQDSNEYFADTVAGCDNPMTLERALEILQLKGKNDIMPGLTVKLMPHQLIGVATMVEQERNETLQGGLLCDEMGLGKVVSAITTSGSRLKCQTLEIIALIVFNKSQDINVKTTLVVAESSIIRWKEEIRKFTTRGLLRVGTYHGPDRKLQLGDELEDFDVVISTYGSLTTEAGLKSEREMIESCRQASLDGDCEEVDGKDVVPERQGPPFKMLWYRVVLDEAHYIRNRATKASLAMRNLKAHLRCLYDIFPQLRFTGISPCREFREFDKDIGRIEKTDPALAVKRAQAILKKCMLRRRKDTEINGRKLLELPPKTVDVVEVDFSEEERAIYSSVEAQQQVRFLQFYKEGTVLKNIGFIFYVMMTRLRQLCDHPSLLQEKAAQFDDDDFIDTLNNKFASSANRGSSKRCGKKRVADGTRHDRGNSKKQKVEHEDGDDVSHPIASTKEMASVELSAKMTYLMQCLKADLVTKGDKVVIFSHFVGFLHIVSDHLHAQKIPHLMYHGKMSLAEREQCIATFKKKICNARSPRIMLISIRAGGVGLNLTVASKVYSLDPAWNTASEGQAFDRVHRIGQTKPVVITKMVVTDTFEQRMLKIQREKKALADGAMGEGVGGRLQEWTVHDLANLFGITGC